MIPVLKKMRNTSDSCNILSRDAGIKVFDVVDFIEEEEITEVTA
jgi:hypothetical protein